jgi:two-component system, chemotaxis family, response regulator Rcp1
MTTPIHILLVEDNPGDADLTRESVAASKLRIELTVVVTGAEALEFMHKRGRFASASRPDLILLDLNLPGIDGRAVLGDIKRDADLKRIPVCILTSSGAETDVVQGYNLGANCYVVKPIDFKTFQNIVQAVEGFWFTIVKLPASPEDARSGTKQSVEAGGSAKNQ